ncbi:hypothetical protein D3C78_914190 [compost metagenome]
MKSEAKLYNVGDHVILGKLESPFCWQGIFTKGTEVQVVHIHNDHYTVKKGPDYWWVSDHEIDRKVDNKQKLED